MNGQAAFARAIAAHQAGKFGEADDLYRQVLTEDPRNFPARYQLALLHYQQQRLPEAADAVAAALSLNSDSREGLMLRSVIMLGLKNLEQALESVTRCVTLEPRDTQAWHNRGVILAELSRFEEAVASYDRILATRPTAEAFSSRAAALMAMSRPEEALGSLDQSLALKPNFAGALCYRGNALMQLKRFHEAIPAFDAALAQAPGLFDAWSNRGLALYELDRLGEALDSYDQAVAIRADDAGAWTNRGKVLAGLNRFEESLANYDKALSLAPSHLEAWRARGLVLRSLGRLDEAMESADAALKIEPDFAPATFLRGWLLCEQNQITEGLAEIRREAERLRRVDPSGFDHKRRHDQEQADYLLARGLSAVAAESPILAGHKLDAPAIRRANVESATRKWEESCPRIAVIDDFLSDNALERLREFCWGSTVWRSPYNAGYLGAFPEQGFACPLLAQIAEELRDEFQGIIGSNPLRMLWAFKYDSRLRGIGIHADQAAVNVNFWITPDDANLDKERGGMIIWDVAAPADWDAEKYNGDEPAVRAFLAQSSAKPVTIPYRSNRAVIFDSDLFHETDAIIFKEGYLNRRINVTMLYGRRTKLGR